MDPEAAFDAYHEALYRYLVHLLGDQDLAADAAQEAFVRMVQRPPRTASNLRAWLYTVATNYAFDVLKVARRRSELLSTVADPTPVGPPAPAPGAALEQNERRDAVRKGLDRLREKDRAVLVMRAEGFSYGEIAAAVGIPSNSVGAVAARGLRKLATLLQSREPEFR